MKVTDVSAMILRYQYDNAIADAQNYFYTRSAVIVKVKTDEGIEGIGESACFGGPAETTKYVIEHELADLVRGGGPDQYRTDLAQGQRPHPPARAGRDHHRRPQRHRCGAVGYFRKKAGLPVYKLLGGYSDRLLPYASSGFYSVGKDAQKLAAEAEGYFRQGFRYAKIKIGRNPDVFMSPIENMLSPEKCIYTLEEELERVRACCEAAKKYGARIMVDVNNVWNTYTAIRMGKKFQEMGVFWMEEPLSLDNVDGSAELARALDMPVAGYESEVGLFRFKQFMDKRAIDIVQPDVIWSGGFTECRRIAHYAQANSLPCMPHVFSSAVSLAANAHFLASLSNRGILEMDRNPYPLRDELLTEPIEMAADGYVYLPQKPGLGIELREDTIEKYRVD